MTCIFDDFLMETHLEEFLKEKKLWIQNAASKICDISPIVVHQLTSCTSSVLEQDDSSPQNQQN